MKTSRNKGFTLIELMMTIAILGILVAIAYPSYMDYLYRTRRTDGQTALLRLSVLLEHYYTENNAYTGATITGLGMSETSEDGYYTLTIPTLTATSYSLTATPAGEQANDTTCPTLTLTNTNVRGPSATCWGG